MQSGSVAGAGVGLPLWQRLVVTAVPTWEFLTDSAQRGRDPAQEHGAFLAAHPKLSIDLVLNDRTVDLIEEGVDIGLRWRGAAQTNPEVRRRL